MYKKITIILFLAASLTVTGCASKLYDAEILHEKAINITKLTRKVKVAIRKKISNENLQSYIVEKYSEDINEFSDYFIAIKNNNGTAVVLMCDKDKTKALKEDLSCTASIEGSEHFKENLTCDFHLDIDKYCN